MPPMRGIRGSIRAPPQQLSSSARGRLSKSRISIALAKVSTTFANSAASAGASAPRATAAAIVSIAAARSAGLRIGGSASGTSRSRCGAIRRSRQSRKAAGSPPRASSTALRVKASASPSSSRWAACVDRLRHPCGAARRIAGTPLLERAPPLFLLFFAGLSAVISLSPQKSRPSGPGANKRTAGSGFLAGQSQIVKSRRGARLRGLSKKLPVRQVATLLRYKHIYDAICQETNSEKTNDENPVNNLAASHSFGEEPTARDPPPRATK